MLHTILGSYADKHKGTYRLDVHKEIARCYFMKKEKRLKDLLEEYAGIFGQMELERNSDTDVTLIQLWKHGQVEHWSKEDALS